MLTLETPSVHENFISCSVFFLSYSVFNLFTRNRYYRNVTVLVMNINL